MSAGGGSIDRTLFIGQSGEEPVPLPFDELLGHYVAIRDAIANAVHREHDLEPELKSLVPFQSFGYAFNNFKALGLLLPELYHESGAVVLRQLWEVALNLHWIEGDPDVRARAFCGFTVMENRKLLQKKGADDELADFDAATAAFQAQFRFHDRNGKERVYSDFAAKNVHDRARDLGDPWRTEYDLVYHLTSMHTHGAPGAILKGIFVASYSSPQVRERNSAALLAIIAMRVIVRCAQLLVRMGVLSPEATQAIEEQNEAFDRTMVGVRARRNPT